MQTGTSGRSYTTFEGTIDTVQARTAIRWPTDSTGGDHDNDLLDAWLASLSVYEFEHFLNGLADVQARAPAALAPPA